MKHRVLIERKPFYTKLLLFQSASNTQELLGKMRCVWDARANKGYFYFPYLEKGAKSSKKRANAGVTF